MYSTQEERAIHLLDHHYILTKLLWKPLSGAIRSLFLNSQRLSC
jgi:hypothetical protein